MAYTLVDLASEILQKADIPLSAEEIWNQAQEQGLTEKFKSKNPKKTLGITLARNLEGGENTPFVIVDYRPKRFWLKARKSELESKEVKNKIAEYKESQEIGECEEKFGFKERDLHSLLVSFVSTDSNFKVLCKTIPHEESKKGKGGKYRWMYPDIVGVHYPKYESETYELLRNLGKTPYWLYSFELKIELNLSNIKEYYFQAVSNSSWANEGYLVFLRWSEEEEIREELERLNQAFGIGVIKLNAEDLSSSEVVFFAKRKEELDLKTIDLLVKLNPKFKEFVEDINCKSVFLNSRYSNKKEIGRYDKPFADDSEAQEYIKKHNII